MAGDLLGRYGQAWRRPTKQHEALFLIQFSHHLVPGYPWHALTLHAKPRGAYESLIAPLAEVPRFPAYEDDLCYDEDGPRCLYHMLDLGRIGRELAITATLIAVNNLIDDAQTRLLMLTDIERCALIDATVCKRLDGKPLGPLHYLGEGVRDE